MVEQPLGQASGPAPELEHRSGRLEGGMGDQLVDRPILVERLEVLAATQPVVEALGLIAGQAHGAITTFRRHAGNLRRSGPAEAANVLPAGLGAKIYG